MYYFKPGIFLTLCGLTFAGVPLSKYIDHKTRFSDEVTVMATVIDKHAWRESGSSRHTGGSRSSGHNYSIQYSFTAQNGQQIQGDDTVSHNLFQNFTVGRPAAVFYKRTDPNLNYIKSGIKSNLPNIVIIFATGGGILALCGLSLIFGGIRTFLAKKELKARGHKTNATITRMRKVKGINNSIFTEVTYTWQDAQRNQRKGKTVVRSYDMPEVKVGDEIEILTSREKPKISHWEVPTI